MSEILTIELPDELALRARKLAAAGNRRLEDVVLDWIERVVSEKDVEHLPDDELLQLCDSTFEADAQLELSNLLENAREGTLDPVGRTRLDELMADYRRGLVLKARAWKETVSRGLRPALTESVTGTDHAA